MVADGGAGRGVREARKRATRARLERVALERFAANGYSATSVAEIARAADVSERTFFRYFATKDEVLLHRFEESLDLLLSVIRSAVHAPHPTWHDIERALLAFTETVPSASTSLAVRVTLADESPDLRARVAATVEGWRQRLADTLADAYGRSRFDDDVHMLAAVTVIVVSLAWSAWVVDESVELAGRVRAAAESIRRIVGA